MLQNPLPFQPVDDPNHQRSDPNAFAAAPILKRGSKQLAPLSAEQNAAVNLIRQKLASIYADEPDAETELAEVEESRTRHKSKHQRFMETLQRSGKSIEEIQTAWHNYYQSLPDNEKHEVWQEFYAAAATLRNQPPQPDTTATPSPPPTEADPKTVSQVVVAEHQAAPEIPDKRSFADIKRTLLGTVQRHEQRRLRTRDHIKSLGFGLACGFLVILVFLFSFFNQVIIAPFIQPGRNVGNMPLIINTATTASAITTNEVIIPKINVEIPVNYSETSTNETVIENALQGGVVHYPNTVLPGQDGNAAFFGHSSNNIFNPGKYKFAFVLLHTLVNGDTFYLTYNGTLYAYKVVAHRIVPPNDVSVLNDTLGNPATATLITCDPPGTSINRLVVTGVQISPAPSANSAAPPAPQIAAQPAVLPGNGPSLWSRFVHWLF